MDKRQVSTSHTNEPDQKHVFLELGVKHDAQQQLDISQQNLLMVETIQHMSAQKIYHRILALVVVVATIRNLTISTNQQAFMRNIKLQPTCEFSQSSRVRVSEQKAKSKTPRTLRRKKGRVKTGRKKY